MIRFLNFSLFTILLTIFVASCSGGSEDRNAFLSTLQLTATADEPDANDPNTIINISLEVDLELDPDFEPRTKTYTAKANCVTDSVNVLAFPAYPGLGLTVNGITPDSVVTPINVVTDFGVTNINIFLSGDLFIETNYDLVITRGDPNDPPAIRLLGNLVTNHTKDTAYVDAGHEACDTNNTDLSANVMIGGDTVLINTIGTYLITFDVDDSNARAATQVIRTVNVVENTAPVITPLGSATVTVIQNEVYTDAGATAFDAQEGDLTASINSNGTDIIDTSLIGSYTVTYDLTDAGGLAATQISRTVNVVAP